LELRSKKDKLVFLGCLGVGDLAAGLSGREVESLFSDRSALSFGVKRKNLKESLPSLLKMSLSVLPQYCALLEPSFARILIPKVHPIMKSIVDKYMISHQTISDVA